MRTVVALVISMSVSLLLFVAGQAAAQPPMGPGMPGQMPMMGWPMMFFMGLLWVLLLILMVLAILWLIKQLRK